MALSERVQTLLQVASAAPPIWESGVATVRAQEVVWSRAAGVEPPAVPCTDELAGDVPVRVYEPDGALAGVFVYLHGGGWTTGSIETHDWVCRRIVLASGRRVVSVGYRLAPEHPFPAPLDDCVAATRWAHERFGDPLVVGGDSAGGNLTAAVCIMLRDDDAVSVAAQVLIYPVTDASMSRPSYTENATGYLLTAETMRWFWRQYIGDAAATPGSSVLATEDLSGLPTALVLVAGYDPLRDEGLEYAKRLADAGVAVQVERYDDALHGFIGMDLLFPDECAASIAAIAAFVSPQ